MISEKILQDSHPDIWTSLSYLFGGSSSMPCLFAAASFKKRIMKFTVINKKEEIIKSLSKDLISFSKTLQGGDLAEKTYTTLVVVCREAFNDILEEEDFIENLLINLHSIDPCNWPDGKTKNMNDQDFEFYWNGLSWFPVLLHKTHREKIRISDFITIGFQPGDVFDFNKKFRTEFHERMRYSIHSRISTIYSGKIPFYLSNKSSGKNICQFSGFDKEEYLCDHIYPILN